MPIQYPEILSLKSDPQPFKWGDRETMLYALGIGLGGDPMNETELPFVYESGLKAVPTMATRSCHASVWPRSLGSVPS